MQIVIVDKRNASAKDRINRTFVDPLQMMLANVVGRVVNVPGESNVWKGLGLGLTWRTPWSGQLSVGADNVVTSGKNPFLAAGQDDEGTVPYVRYQQDL